MLKRLASACIVAIALSTSANAANCSANPYNLTNGTSADAIQVMANFNNLLNCGNSNLAPVANPSFTGNVSIAGGGSLSLDVAGQGRFLSPSSGNPGIIVRDAAGNPNQSYISFRSNDALTTYGNVQGLSAGGLAFGGGNVGVNTVTPSLTFFVNGSSGGTAAWQVISDERLKKDIKPLSGALALVQKLNPVSYEWRTAKERGMGKKLNLPTDERQIGFIAQQVAAVVPEAVGQPGDGPDAFYSLKPDNLIPVLVAAIKEQQAQIEQLKASLAALNSAPH